MVYIRTSGKVGGFAEALQKLAIGHYESDEQVRPFLYSGLSMEDDTVKALPHLFNKDLGIEIKGRLKRDFVETALGKHMAVNIFGVAYIASLRFKGM